ncbi:MAG: hypothetical protein ACE5R6_07615 [Candidatus Heimdallarchaeota archaeon]
MAREAKIDLFVPDASVIVRWFLEEKYSAQARALREDYVNGLIELAIPSLLAYEVLCPTLF